MEQLINDYYFVITFWGFFYCNILTASTLKFVFKIVRDVFSWLVLVSIPEEEICMHLNQIYYY